MYRIVVYYHAKLHCTFAKLLGYFLVSSVDTDMDKIKYWGHGKKGTESPPPDHDRHGDRGSAAPTAKRSGWRRARIRLADVRPRIRGGPRGAAVGTRCRGFRL